MSGLVRLARGTGLMVVLVVVGLLIGTASARGEIGPEDEPDDAWLIHTQTAIQGVALPGKFLDYDDVVECMMHIKLLSYMNGVRLPGCIIAKRDWLGKVTPVVNETAAPPAGTGI